MRTAACTLSYTHTHTHTHTKHNIMKKKSNLKEVHFSPVHVMKTYSKNGGPAPLIFNFGARWRWVVNFTPWPLRLPWKNPSRCINWRGRGPRAGFDDLETKR